LALKKSLKTYTKILDCCSIFFKCLNLSFRLLRWQKW